MVSKIIINQIKKKIEKGCGFKLSSSIFEIYYKENVFRLIAGGANGEVQKTDNLVSNFTDLSDILLAKVRDSIDAREINRLDLKLNFILNTSSADVYYIDKFDKKNKIKLDEII